MAPRSGKQNQMPFKKHLTLVLKGINSHRAQNVVTCFNILKTHSMVTCSVHHCVDYNIRPTNSAFGVNQVFLHIVSTSRYLPRVACLLRFTYQEWVTMSYDWQVIEVSPSHYIFHHIIITSVLKAYGGTRVTKQLLCLIHDWFSFYMGQRVVLFAINVCPFRKM